MAPIRPRSLLTCTIVSLALILLSAAGWYYFYWMKTPQYSLGLIQSSIAQRDLDTLRKHVDLTSVYSYGYDDLAEEALPEKARRHPLAAALIKSLKSQAVKELVHETEARFQKEPSPETAGQRAAASFLKNAENRIGTAALSLTDIISVKREGDEALALLRVHDGALQTDFTWQLRLLRNSDGTWRAVQIMNFKDYLQERKKVLQKTP